MDLDLERIAFGSVVGVTGAAVAAGAGRERNQKVNLGEEFDEIAGSNGACLYEVLIRVTHMASAHEYVHHVREREAQLPRAGDPARSRGLASDSNDSSGGISSHSITGWYRGRTGCADDIMHPGAIFVPPIPV